MIGNDIIDIEYTRKYSDWTRRGFLDKVFSVSEQNYITESKDSFTAVWRLWSMKESVYKLHFRSRQVRSFYPSIISCNILDEKKGIVILDGVEYTTVTNCLEEYIFSSVTQADSKEVNHHVIQRDSELTENHYAMIKNKLAIDLDCKNSELDIIKNEIGIPEVYRNDVKQDIYLSITHHGKFLAWSTSSVCQLKFLK